jgi:hypothetical protein
MGQEVSKIRPSINSQYNTKMHITVETHFLEKEELCFYYDGAMIFYKIICGMLGISALIQCVPYAPKASCFLLNWLTILPRRWRQYVLPKHR